MMVDVRIIAATNRNLEQSVQEGSFREDLFYRMNVIPVEMPPLRERREDIELLVCHFVDRFNSEFHKRTKGISDAALELLKRHPWPGNVRELRNVIERAMILENKEILEVDDLPAMLRHPDGGPRSGNAAGTAAFVLPDEGYGLRQMEREMVKQALERTAGNQSHAAELLDISRDALRYKMRKFGLL
jgi:DNA-binding NtrC family response regulator